MIVFLLVDSCLFVGVEPCLRQSVWVAAPCSGVAFPSPNAIEWVADPQMLCRFPPLLRLGGSPTLSHALPWLGRRPCNPLRWLVGGPSLPCSVWWVEDLQMLCGRGKGRGPSPLFARFGQRSKCGVYLLSSSLSAAVKLFTNCKGTTVPYFFITQSIYQFMFLLPLKSLVHLCYYIN